MVPIPTSMAHVWMSIFDCLEEIHKMVEVVRHDKEVSLNYMKVYEREQIIREQGEQIGEARGIKLGEACSNIRTIRNMKDTIDKKKSHPLQGWIKILLKRFLRF